MVPVCCLDVNIHPPSAQTGKAAGRSAGAAGAGAGVGSGWRFRPDAGRGHGAGSVPVRADTKHTVQFKAPCSGPALTFAAPLRTPRRSKESAHLNHI